MNRTLWLAIVFGVLSLFLLPACAPKGVVCPDGTVVKRAELCPEVQEAQRMLEEYEQLATDATRNLGNARDGLTETTKPSPGRTAYDEKLSALLALNKKVTSMRFIYAPIELTPTGSLTKAKDTYLKRGSRAKAEILWVTNTDPKTYVDTAYLDLGKRSVEGFCLDRKRGTCSVVERRPAAFEKYDIIYPDDWAVRIPPDAVLTGSRSFKNREVSVVKYRDGDEWYELLIDIFSGLPVRVGIYADEEYTRLVGGAEYHEFAINTVREADVTPPAIG